MKHCDRCGARYSDEFGFCPTDGTALQAAECEDQDRASVSAGCVRRSKFHISKWALATLVIVLAIGAVLAFRSLTAVPSHNQDASQTLAVDKPKTNPKPLVKQKVGAPRRVSHASAAEPEDSGNAPNDLVQQTRAQQLVATGYRNMQQRDYEGARDAFEQALEIDPHSITAQKGLKAAQTAENVEGIVGVFRR